MALRRDRRWIWVIGIALFCLGFSYGVYQSFKEMHGIPGADRVLPRSEPDPGGLDGGGALDDLILDFWTEPNPANHAGPDESTGLQSGTTSHDEPLLAGDNGDVYYLGIHQNRVAVFEGPPTEGHLYRVTDRSVDSLPPREVASLQSGIRVIGEREMLKALEGYMQ